MRRAPILGAGIALAMAASANHAAFAEDAPKGNQGYTTPTTIAIDLGKEIPGMSGWQLRLRVLNIAPGGHIGLHNHKDRPAVVYFDQGTDVVTNEDGTSRTFHSGDTTAEGVNTVHWHKNTGNGMVIIYTADLVKAPAK
ncbi:cupin domain-containing protein [Bradyrhizobium sp.]|uniref:cupin domain-containing protein n=1 Tax=Bradyrhizobium sp. TaxID=376 RepID=UPI002B65CEE2|nr:cupin domain-containing protein [Bradyrhizobium sp.]HMM89078.1 cupin domain-containing protein [Bradyrhizobium sp.]